MEYLDKKIRIIFMSADSRYNGKEGVVEYVDNEGLLHGTWGDCAVVPDIDDFEVIDALVG